MSADSTSGQETGALGALYRHSAWLVHYTNAILRVLVVLLLVVMIIDVALKVGMRQIDKIFHVSTSTGKTEEIPALLLIWVALIGGSLAVGERAHLGIDALVRLFPRTCRLVNDQFIHVCMVAFSAVALLWGGGKLAYFTFVTKQVTPALGLPMGYVYLAIPLAGFFNLVYLVHLLLTGILQLLGRGPEVETE